MKVFINKPNENWIVDRMCNEWYELAPEITTKNILESDIICFPVTIYMVNL